MEQTKDNLTPPETPQSTEVQPVVAPEGQPLPEVQAPVDNQSQIQELTRKVSELSNENAALNTRFQEVGMQQQQIQQQVQTQNPASNEDYVIAMQKAAEGDAEEAAKYLQRAREKEQQQVYQRVSQVVDTNYLLRKKEEDILRDKPYLKPVQAQMEQRFLQIAQTGCGYDKALTQAVEEFDNSFKAAVRLHQPANQTAQVTPPNGSQGVTAQQPQVVVPTEKPIASDKEWVATRKDESFKKFI